MLTAYNDNDNDNSNNDNDNKNNNNNNNNNSNNNRIEKSSSFRALYEEPLEKEKSTFIDSFFKVQ